MRQFLGKAEAQRVLSSTRPYARAQPWIATWQIVSTLGLLVATLLLASHLGPGLWLAPLALWSAGLFVRIFVLQHDLGHRSAYRSREVNDRLGLLLSFITSVPFEAWRTEHNWHHNHQGRLSKRGIDNMNSPMTVEEVPQRPAEARYRINKVSARNIFLIGIVSLMIERRFPKGFFPFREKFTDPVRNRREMLWGIVWTLPIHLLLHALVWVTLGWWVSVLVMVPALLIGSGIGGLLFWVQHNFEQTYYADDEDWNAANAAIFGSSYLKLGPLGRWFTASIGLHHVHHLNQRIPNYSLERARREIPELAAVKPLTRKDLSRSFTHLFWDREAKRMRAPEELDVRLEP